MRTEYESIHSWLSHLESQGKSKHTLSAYRRALNHFTNWSRQTYGGEFDPSEIIPRDVRDWKFYQQSIERAAPSTINQRLVALSQFFSWAVNQNFVRSDPTVEIKTIRLPARKPKGLSKKDLRRLLRTTHQGGNLRDIAIIELLAGSGLRVGELLQLQIGDITIKKRSGSVVIRHGKQDSFREVPLARDVRYALSSYLEAHPASGDPNAALWLGARGSLQHRSSILRMLNKYALQAGLSKMGPHILRHTFATQYLNANPDDLRGLAALLGHSNLDNVMIYTEPSLDDLAARLEKMNAI